VNTLSYKTVSANKLTVQKEWYVVDATGQTLGRFCSKIAQVLRGKHRPYYTPHVDCGDNVIVINAEKIRVTGNKAADKLYTTYSGYPGGQKQITFAKLMKKHPVRILERGIKGMLPHNKLGDAMYRNLRVVVGDQHEHQAQNPKVLDLNTIK